MKNTTAFIILLISIGLFYTFVMPQWGKVQDLRAQASQYQQVLGNVSDLTQKRDELTLQYQQIPKDQINNLAVVLPDNVNVVELALNLDAVASKYGIAIKGIKTVDNVGGVANFAAASSSSPYNKVDVAFSFISTYDNFRKFLGDLEQSMRIIDVKDIKFQVTPVAGSNPSQGLNQYDMQIETYWIK